MYVILAKSTKIEKSFDKLIKPLSDKVKSTIFQKLSKSPKTTTSDRSINGRIEKKGIFWQYYVSWGNRIIYEVIDKPNKTVVILFAGNHNDAKIFLRNH